MNALSVALESDWPAGTDPIVHHDGQHPDGTPIINYEGGQETIVAAAVEAAKRLGPAARPLKADLERIAADKGHPVTAEAASEALGLLLQQAPDPNSKQIITIVEPAPPPNSAPSSPRDREPSVVVPQLERPAVLYEPGWGYVANAGALREHIKSAKKPQASGNGIVALRLMITATGAFRKADVTAARDPLQRAAVLKAAESWTFTPFGPEVVGIVPITFKDGVAHSFLWD